MRFYGALDVAFAALYAWLGFVVAPSRSTGFQVALAIVVALVGGAGVGLIARARWARPAALAASVVLLIFAAVLIFGLVASSAYLRGVYGALGRGMAVMGLGVAAIVVELFALLPIFQIRFLLKSRA